MEGAQADTCPGLRTPKRPVGSPRAGLLQPAPLRSVPFCHSGFVLLSQSISVTSFPPLICHSKDFKYRLTLGDSDTYQWIQVSTHDQSSLKLSHSPNDSSRPRCEAPHNHVISARMAHTRMSPELPAWRACHGVSYSLLTTTL